MCMNQVVNFFRLVVFLSIVSLSAGCGDDSNKDSDGAKGENVNYSQADLSSDWGVNALATGPAAPWWQRGTMSVQSDGSYSMATSENDGGTGDVDSDTGTIHITADGMVSDTGSTWSGALDAGKTVIVGTSTWDAEDEETGSSDMTVCTKKAQTCSIEDLEGTWQVNTMASGPLISWSGSGTFEIASDATFTYSAIDNEQIDFTLTGMLDLSDDGILLLLDDVTFEGRIDADKTVMVATLTWPEGTSEMMVFTKKAASYSQGDLEGTWAVYSLASGLGAPYWFKATATVDAGGSFSGPATVYDGGETTSETISGDVSISADGTMDNNGHMDAGKTVMSFSYNWSDEETGTTEMSIWLKLAR